MSNVLIIFRALWDFFWPFIIFFVLVPLTTSIWLYWRQEIFRRAQQVLFEMRMPREILKSPEAMEQVLHAIANLRNIPGDLSEVWMDGELPRVFALELVSFGGELHWYVRCYWKLAPLVKASFYSYYPDIEMILLDTDYITRFPEDVREMKAQGYDMYGTELQLVKESAYPIRTYKDFETPDEDKQNDPIGVLIESLAQTQKDQIVAIQMLIIPADPMWNRKFAPLVERLKESAAGGSKAPSKKGAARTWDFSSGLLPVLGVAKIEKKDEMPFKSLMRTPGETKALEAVEDNLSKPAFETVIRMLYFSPHATYYDSFAKRGVVGSFNQYSATGLNAFIANNAMTTLTKSIIKPYVFPKTRRTLKQERILYNYRHRVVPPETMVGRILSSHPLNWNFSSRRFLFTTQCLATIFHPPTKFVTTAPHMKRVDSRKAGPPAGLAIFGEDADVERFR